MFETALKFLQNYVLYRTGIFENVMQEIKVHFCNLVVISLKSYIELQYIPKLGNSQHFSLFCPIANIN